MPQHNVMRDEPFEVGHMGTHELLIQLPAMAKLQLQGVLRTFSKAAD
mgnify:FL=1